MSVSSGVTPPFDLKAIDHVVLIVDGLDDAVKWYAEVVGATEEGDLRQFGMVQLRCGASMIDLVDAASAEGGWAMPDVDGGRNMDHLCLEIGPVTKKTMESPSQEARPRDPGRGHALG